MKKLFIISLILAVIFAVGWEVLSYYVSRYTGLVLYGHLIEMTTTPELSLPSQRIITQPENELVAMHFEGKPLAVEQPGFYTAKLMDANANSYKMQTAIWDPKKPSEDYLVFAVPKNTEIATFGFSDQEAFPIKYFREFGFLQYRNALGIVTLTLIALAIVLWVVKYFKGEAKPEEHVDPFDFMNKPKAA